MSTSGVYNALNSFIQNNTIDLWTAANGSGDLAGLLPVLKLFGIQSDYILTEVVLTQISSGTGVRLTGAGNFNGVNTFPANATLQYLDQGNIFILALAITTDWIFSDHFPPLPPTLMGTEELEEGIIWQPSVLNGMKVRAAVFTGTSGADSLNLTGFLLEPNNPYLLSKTPMIGPWPLRLYGTVNLPNDSRSYPLINLDARGNDTIINGAKEPGVDGPDAIALANPGLTLLVQPLIPEQPDRIAFSTIELFANFTLGEINGRIATLILSTQEVWNFSVRFEKGSATFVQGLAQLTGIFGVELPIPMDFPVLSDFYIAEIDIDLENTSNTLFSFSLLNLGITIRSDKTWTPPLPFVTLNNVGTRWVWGWSEVTDDNGDPEKVYTLTGSVFGTFNFGSSNDLQTLPPEPLPPSDEGGGTQLTVINDPVSIDVKMSLPDFIISGSLADDSYIPIGQALTYFFGNTGPSTGLQSMNITGLTFSADPIGQNYFARATILFGDPEHPDEQQGWEINLFIITIILNQLEFEINVNNGNIGGGITGTFYLEQDDPTDYNLPRIIIGASYPVQHPDNPEGWTLTGYLYPGTSISLTKLVYQFIYGKNQTPPDWIPDITVDELNATFTTGVTTGNNTTKPSYKFNGTISARWEPVIFNTTLKINAAASVDMEKSSAEDTPSGTLTGTFSVNRITLTASLTFGVPEPTYLFKVQFDQLWLQATTSWRGEQDNRHQVVSLQLGGVTLGDMLEYLVNLAAPTLGFRLDTPWDVLKKVELSRFVLTIDPQENIVEFVFNADVDLIVAKIDSIGVRYSKDSGEGKVNLILTGSFMGEQYTNDKPLSWDVINDPPPAVPGQGKSLVNLRYMGLGQRVTFNGDTPGTVAESISKLRQNMTEPPAEGNPLPQTMKYAADSQWLIGLDIQLMETVDLALIFNDPKLYGLSIALGGERAGSLAGLRFEILYKKITDDIGMFRIEFQVPDMFRTIQLGVVSLTLGIIVVEIYTNGNFKIDLGFPYNRDFSRSFSLQATIFIGRGGFYLGVLNGDTSTQVPRISNGNFSPVIELGIGLAVGVGREIREGILSGGAYIELQVIFQGVLAWFNPNSNGVAKATYFKAQGIAALHGKIYGSIDFKVIKVSVTLEAYAQISIVYECYQPMQITFSVDVRAEASITVLFITVHFSFHVNLEFKFTVGSAQPTPWLLSNNNTGGTSLRGEQTTQTYTRNRNSAVIRNNQYRRQQALRYTHYAVAAMNTTLRSTAAVEDEYIMNWQPANKVFNDAPRNAHLTMLPLFTIGNVPVNWTGETPENTTPDYRTAFVLFADTGIDPSALTAADTTVRSAAHSAMASSGTDTSVLAADILTEGLLYYALNAFPRGSEQGNNITAAQLELLLEQLDMPETLSAGLSIPQLKTFFKTNIHLWISGDVKPTPDIKSGMFLPVPPFLSWTSQQGGDIDFSKWNKIGPWYEWGISVLLNAYLPVGANNSDKPAIDDPSAYESFTSFMFRDYCLMVMKNGIVEIQKQLSNTTVTVHTIEGTVQSLEQVAATLPNASVLYTIAAGDTVENVAAGLGATVDELLFLNPDLISDLETGPVGRSLTIILGIAPEMLAIDNADKPFAIDQCILGTLVHQAADDDTLKSISDLFQVATVSDLLSYSREGFPVLSAGSNILQAGSTFDLPAQIFTNAPADFFQLRTAAVFFVRYIDLAVAEKTPVPDMANWYVQAIAEINQSLLKNLFPDEAIPAVIELPPGQVLSVPNTFNNQYSIVTNRNNYTTVAGDTLNRIGFALTFQQDYGTTMPAGIPQWQVFQAGVTAIGVGSWSIPSQPGIIVEAGATIASLVRRLIVDAIWTGQYPDGTWAYNWVNVAVWIAQAHILQPLASITVPDAKTAVLDNLNFNTLSVLYGLTIADAAARLKTLPGLYADGTILSVKWLPAQDIDVLVNAVLQGDSFAAIVNQSSRMLMSGLQLPGRTEDENGHIIPDPANPLPLYDLTGQQFSITVDDQHLSATALSLSLSAEEDWILFFNSVTVQEGMTLPGLEASYPDLLTYNPGLSDATFKTGMILLTAPAGTLDYNYTNQDILDIVPAKGLSIVPVPADPPAPAIMNIRGTVPRTYGLEHRIELQTPVSLPIPQDPLHVNISGNPGIWMLPADLREKATNGVTTLYEILSAQPDGEAGSEAIEINSSTWGTIIPFKIKRLNESAEQFNLIGTDTADRLLLLQLSNWLRSQLNTDSTKAYLLLSPAPNATNTSGLTLLIVAASDIFLVKSNLSTLSVPPAFSVKAATDDSIYFASLSSLANFLVLLWEGSVVGGVGYYFSPGVKIPGSAYDEQGNITLQILVIAGPQQSPAPGGRSLLEFNNCVLTGPGADSNQMSLFIQSAGSNDPSETIAQALVPPGNVGFDLVIDNPDKTTLSDKELQLKKLYSLLTFEVTGVPFNAPASGMPVMPAPWDGDTSQPWEKTRAVRKARTAGMKTTAPEPQRYWRYMQVMPVSGFVPESVRRVAMDVKGLPPAGQDPYIGYGTQTSLPAAGFVFGFGDVLGNRTGQTGINQGITSIPVGYTDNLISIAEWPSTARYFNVVPDGAGALLSVVIAPRPSSLLPGPSQRGDVNKDLITQQQQLYSQVYYQLIQPGITGWLVSSLNFISDPDYINKGTDIGDISRLWKFAAGAYAVTSGLNLLQPAKPAGVNTLGDIITKYGIRYAELAVANADQPLQALFGNTLPVVPAYYAFVQYLSITAFYALPPAGWPLPGNAITLLTLPENTSLPLKAGTALSIPDKHITTGTQQPTDSLQVFANSNFTSVEALAIRNITQPVLQPGFEFVMELDDTTEMVVVVDDNINSFQLVVAAFAQKGVNISAGGLAVIHKDAGGMLAINQALAIDTYIVQDKDTLAKNNSGNSISVLANGNANTPDLFDPGALIYFGNFTGITLDSMPVTLAQFADRYACPVELLLMANSGFVLPDDDQFLLPGTLDWPADTSAIEIPYTIRTGDTLNDIAKRFNFDTTLSSAGMQLASLNENMSGTISPDQDITIPVNNVSYVINSGNGNPSFATVLLSLQQQAPLATLEDVVTAIGDKGNILAVWGLLLCPPAKFVQDTTPASIPGMYGISAATFALGNTAISAVIAPGKTLQVEGVTVITGDDDTFNSLIVRFATAGIQLGADDIVNANMTVAFIRTGALAFIPPMDVSFSTVINNGGPYESPITPLAVSLRLIRPLALIYPAFKTDTGTGSVEMTETDFPAPVTNSDESDSLNFNNFITTITTALPQLRIGTAQVNGIVQDLWQVDFDSNGIEQVTLIGATTINGVLQPRFFALIPLYDHLVTRTISLASLNQNGLLSDKQDITLQSIDVELWARRFFEELDRFLSGEMTVAVYNNANIRNQLKLVMDAKAALIPAIAAGLDAIPDLEDPGKAGALVSAIEALQQQLGVSLSKTYETNVLIQYNSTVHSQWQSNGALKPASLYGDGDIFNAQEVTGLTMIAAKIALADASSYVNFLMTLDNPALHKKVTGSFQYAISHLEFNITSEEVPGSYTASDWLTFLPLLSGTEKPTALSGTDPGALTVPVPLRNFPSLPVIIGQEAYQTYPDGTQEVNLLGLWNYSFTYTHEHAAQDYVILQLEFNLTSPSSFNRSVEEPRDLFTELAQYITVADPLWDLLNALIDPLSQHTAGDVENAVRTFTTLVTNISQYWNARLVEPAYNTDIYNAMVAGLNYELNARAGYRNSGDLDMLTLTRLTEQPGPRNAWPEVYVQLPTGFYIQLNMQAGATNTAIYKVPDDLNISPVNWPVFRLVWTELNVASVQNVRSRINVQRNQDLLDTVATNPVFLFSTDTVIAPSIVTPLNTYGERIDITGLGNNLTDALNACFNGLFGEQTNGQKVTIELGYGFELVAPSQAADQGLVSYLPIGLYPNQTLSATTAAELDTIIQHWYDINLPVENGGEWIFSLRQYAQLTDNAHTLLNIKSLVYRLT